MKIAIIYASKYGATEKVSGSIADKLKGTNEVELFSLKKNPQPDIGVFDTVIIGTSIYAGQASKKVKAFCKEHEALLLQKRIGLFICGMHPDEVEREKELKNAFPEVLLKKSSATKFLGGAYLFEQMNFFERMIIKKIAKTTENVEQIDWGRIGEFVKEIVR